jgi:hypothetical protein
MSPTPPSWDQLQQVHELNRLFLTYLQARVRDDRDCLGLPDGARPILRKTSPEMLAAIGEFPRALFDLALDDRAAPPVRDPLPSRDDAARHALCLTILLCAWSLSRQSVYHARLLLGLEPRAIKLLREKQLSDLQQLAHLPRLILCAFAGRDWLWTELLTDARPEARQQLALIALQPGLARDWPERRASRLSP